MHVPWFLTPDGHGWPSAMAALPPAPPEPALVLPPEPVLVVPPVPEAGLLLEQPVNAKTCTKIVTVPKHAATRFVIDILTLFLGSFAVELSTIRLFGLVPAPPAVGPENGCPHQPSKAHGGRSDGNGPDGTLTGTLAGATRSYTRSNFLKGATDRFLYKRADRGFDA